MRLNQEQINEFKTKGVFVVKNVLKDTDFEPVIRDIHSFIDVSARQLKSEGKIKDIHENEPFESRIIFIYDQYPLIDSEMDIMNSRLKGIFDFLRNENLLEIVSSLLGDELTCSPIQHIRAKPPAKMIKNVPNFFYGVPWHQDAAVTLEEADTSEIYTFWIPLVDATMETGCMDVMPGAFKKGLLKHISSSYGTSIDPELLPDIEPKPVPCPKGGMVIMNKYTPHRSGTNNSNIARWSIDLRYQKTGTPTGRPFHPAIVVKSKSKPQSVLTNHSEWCELWKDALENSKGKKIHRVN